MEASSNLKPVFKLPEKIQPGSNNQKHRVLSESTPSFASEMRALKGDLSSLVAHFALARSAKFPDFVQLWQEMRMPELMLVATAQRPDPVLRLVVREVFGLSVCLFIDPTTEEYKRYGALFLMYSLYCIQTTVPKLKIRLTLEAWELLRQVLDGAVAAQLWDVVYIGGSLVSCNAFHFVASLWPLIPEKSDDRQKNAAKIGRAGKVPVQNAKPLDIYTQHPTVSEIMQRLSDNSEQFEMTSSQYMRSKQDLGCLRLPGLDRADASDVLAKIQKLADVL